MTTRTGPLTIHDGNSRLSAEVDPITHRMHLTMEVFDSFAFEDDDDAWEPVGTVTLNREQMAQLADALDMRLVGGGHE